MSATFIDANKAKQMDEQMQRYAVDCATQALKKYYNMPDIAEFIKTEFEKKYFGDWNCVVVKGQEPDMGSCVTHGPGKFICFYLEQVGILLFKN